MTLSRMTSRGMRRAARSAGFTLIELTIALGIASVLFSAVVVGIGSLTGAKARESAGELAGTIRSLYDTAALTGKTCRLVFELPKGRDLDTPVNYRAECASAAVTAAADRDEALKDAAREDEDRERNRNRSGSGFGNGYQELMAAEQDRVEKAASFSSFTNPEIESRALPDSVRVAVWTRTQREYTEAGTAFLYFFPQGFTEKAHVVLRQGDNAWTLVIEPLTGKVKVVGEALEVPR